MSVRQLLGRGLDDRGLCRLAGHQGHVGGSGRRAEAGCVVGPGQGPVELAEDGVAHGECDLAVPHRVNQLGQGGPGRDIGVEDGTDHPAVRGCPVRLRSARIFARTQNGVPRGDLTGAWLTGADLTEANLSGALLNEANLATARNLTQQQVESAHGDGQTKLPDGLQRPAHWPADPAAPLAADR